MLALPVAFGRTRIARHVALVSLVTLGCQSPWSPPPPPPPVDLALLPNPRVGGAVDAALGYVGFKGQDRSRAFQRQGNPPWTELKTRVTGEIQLTAADTQRLGAAFGFQFARLKIAGGSNSTGTVSYKRVVLQIDDMWQTRSSLNTFIRASEQLRKDLENGDSRLVDAVDMVYGYRATGTSADSLSAGASLVSDSLVFNAGTTKRWSIALSDGMVMSYRLAKLCWNAGGEIEVIIQDTPGRGNECPAGTNENRAKIR